MPYRFVYDIKETRSVIAETREEADKFIEDPYNLDYEVWDQDYMFVGKEEAFPGLDKLLNGPSIFDEPDDGSKQIREFIDKVQGRHS